MTFGDYSRTAWEAAKARTKNEIKKKLVPVLLKYVLPLVLLFVLFMFVAISVGSGGGSDEKEMDLTGFDGFYGNTVEEKVWFALRGAGYSEYAVAGVMGNIYAESGFNSDLIEKGNGIGFGLCQWSYGRRKQYEKYAKSKGVSPSDVDTQIEFLLAEITPGGGANGFATYQLMNHKGYKPSDWKNATSAENAAIAFCWTFERPGVPRMNVRTTAARKYYEQFKGQTAPSGGSGTYTKAISGISKGTLTWNGKKFVLFSQSSPQQSSWIRSHGCGPTSIAIILSGYGYGVTPEQIAQENGKSNNISVNSKSLTKRGFTFTKVTKNINTVKSHLAQGGTIIVRIPGGTRIGNYTYKGGHFMAILGINNNNQVFIADPGTWNSDTNGWYPVQEIVSKIDRCYLIKK